MHAHKNALLPKHMTPNIFIKTQRTPASLKNTHIGVHTQETPHLKILLRVDTLISERSESNKHTYRNVHKYTLVHTQAN